MTTVTYSAKNGVLKLSAQGHATGSEQVCAGISALVYSMAGYVDKLFKKEDLPISTMRLDDGDVLLAFEETKNTRAAFDMVVEGFRMMAAQYPEYINTREEN